MTPLPVLSAKETQLSSHIARGSVCIFKCPESSVEGNNVSSSIRDSARLNCRYTTRSVAGIQSGRMYNKVRNPAFLESSLTNPRSSIHWRIVERRNFLFYCPRTGVGNNKRRHNISNHYPVPKYFQARAKLEQQGQEGKILGAALIVVVSRTDHKCLGHAMDNCRYFTLPSVDISDGMCSHLRLGAINGRVRLRPPINEFDRHTRIQLSMIPPRV